MRMETRYNLDLPYPPVAPGRDPKAVSLLLEDYSGAVSELSAITQYFYGSARMRGCYQPVYQGMKYVAVAEMCHLDLLAQRSNSHDSSLHYVGSKA